MSGDPSAGEPVFLEFAMAKELEVCIGASLDSDASRSEGSERSAVARGANAADGFEVAIAAADVVSFSGSDHSAGQDLDEFRSVADVYFEYVSSMTATRPGVVRGIRVFRFLQYAPLYWMRGRLDLLHRFSEEVTQLDEFWSHSWRDAAWTKYVNILYLSSGASAFVVGTLGAALACTLFMLGALPEWHGNYWRCQWCTLFGIVSHYSTMLLCLRQKRVFLDIACIDQRNQEAKGEGLASMGAILKRSRSMLVLWCPSYVTW